MLTTVAISGYRSLRDVVVPLRGLDVVTGANGSGKSSLYRSLRLLAGCGRGDVIGTLAREGGLQSALWAGPVSLSGARTHGYAVQGTVRKSPVSLRLGFATEELGYLVDLGLPVQGPASDNSGSAFLRDPEIKREIVWAGPVMRPNAVLVRRRWGTVEVRGGARGRPGTEDDWYSGRDAGWESDPEPVEPTPGRTRGWTPLTTSLRPWESMLTELADPDRAPELLQVRRLIQGWRFYDGFRADAAAPARQAHVGTRTPVLADDGADLAAALQTIRENGRSGLDAAIADAFQGATLDIPVSDGRFDVHLHQPGMLRPLAAAELSDGTLRYLCLVAALLTVDPPPLMVLNEPETSLHPDLLPPLARLIRTAAERSQVMVVSHSEALARELGLGEGDDDADEDDPQVGLGSSARRITLVKDLGETFVEGQGLLTTPAWNWGSRR
ncbi:AAA family ATPase [Knoellia sinensis]|uniref:AAA family ATPase n=1 Tax=Knoellia sinensis TaxID=136100 RepID=UPI00056A609E|nr:AAA family ATPase [Knoellia sinensis]